MGPLGLTGVSQKSVYTAQAAITRGETVNKTSLLVLAGALAMAVLLATGATLVYAKAAWSERGAAWGSAAASPLGLKLRQNADATAAPASPPAVRALRWEIRKAVGPRVEVSEEYRERVLSIAREDPDVAKLLEEGYNITNVRPIVKAYVKADGSVELRADEAAVVMAKRGGIAVALVSLKEGRVTKVVVYTRSLTVIQK